MSKTIGILGAGQLAQMLSIAANEMGLKTLCLSQAENNCASHVTDVMIDTHKDATLWQAFCDKVDVVTLETENIPLDMAEFISEQKPLLPNLKTLSIGQDRGHEKAMFSSLDIPTAKYCLVDSRRDLNQAISELGLPLVLKTRRFGYDGKGQHILRTPEDADNVWEGIQHEALIAESFVDFDTEVSLVGACNTQNEIEFYPLVENTHHDGILYETIAPFWQTTLNEQAQNYMHKVMEHLNYVGVMAIEFFLKGDELIANEMAPRVHNTGHWSIEGATVSQFKQHLLAITGEPLKKIELKGTSVMLNCIGNIPSKTVLEDIRHTFFHHYGKEQKPFRKLGHVTVVHNHRSMAVDIAETVKESFPFLPTQS